MRIITKVMMGAVLAVGAFFAFNAVQSTTTAADTSPNAVVRGGTYSMSTLRSSFNKDASVRNIFSHYGMNSDTVNNATYKEGYVTRDGNVVVNGETVATGAMTAGRQYIAGSTKRTVGGTTFYERTPGVSFRSSQLSSFVFFDANGKFIGAVIKDCGNPVSATPKQPQQPFKPLIPGKPVEPTTPPAPAYKCDSLTPVSVNQRDTWTYTAKATGTNGAVLQDFTYTFDDGTAPIRGGNTITKTYTQPNRNYTVKATANFKLPSGQEVTDTNVNCTRTVSVGQLEQPKNPGVKIEKTVNGPTSNHATVQMNKPFTYEIKVTNTGDVTLKQFTVNDFAPAGITFTGADQGTVTADKWQITVGELQPTKSITFKITAVAKVQLTGTIKNTACVNTNEIPGNPDDCDDATVDMPKPEEVSACNTTTGIIEQIEKGKENTAPYTTDLSKCNKVEVCEISTGKTVEVNPVDQNKPEYAPVGDAKCKVDVCDTTTGDIITVDKKDANNPRYADKDSDKCKEPTTPTPTPTPTPKPTPAPEVTELPQTGMADLFSGVAGLGAMTAASYYYLASRRNA